MFLPRLKRQNKSLYVTRYKIRTPSFFCYDSLGSWFSWISMFSVLIAPCYCHPLFFYWKYCIWLICFIQVECITYLHNGHCFAWHSHDAMKTCSLKLFAPSAISFMFRISLLFYLVLGPFFDHCPSKYIALISKMYAII